MKDSTSNKEESNVNADSNDNIAMHGGEADLLNGKATQNAKHQQDPFWSKEAQTISELPKVLSVFFNENGKLRRTSYILNYRDSKSLNDIIVDLKKLFQVQQNDQNDNQDIAWKLYNFNGQAIKRVQDLYFQFASSFLLCKKPAGLKLPSVQGHNNLISGNGQDQVEGRTNGKLPNVHQFRPNSDTADFLGRRGNGQSSVKPYLSKREMGWIFGASNLKIVDPERKRKTRSVSPNSKKPIVSEEKKIHGKPPEASKFIQKANSKAQSAKSTKFVKADVVVKRSLSADEQTKGLILNKGKAPKKLLKQSEVAEVNNAKKKKTKKVLEAGDNSKPVCETAELHDKQSVEVKEVEHIDKDKQSVELKEDIEQTVTELNKLPAKQENEGEVKQEIVPLKPESVTERPEPIMVIPVDLFGVPLHNVSTVRRGSLPLKNWIIPMADNSTEKNFNDATNNATNKKQSLKSSRNILKTGSLDIANVKRSADYENLSPEVERIPTNPRADESLIKNDEIAVANNSELTNSQRSLSAKEKLNDSNPLDDLFSVQKNNSGITPVSNNDFESIFLSQKKRKNNSLPIQSEIKTNYNENKNEPLKVNRGEKPMDQKLSDEIKTLFAPTTAVDENSTVSVATDNQSPRQSYQQSDEFREAMFVKDQLDAAPKPNRTISNDFIDGDE